MSYREENGKVILTMSWEDYEKLLMALGMATASALARPEHLQWILGLMNRLSEGNPDYIPYPTGDNSSVHEDVALRRGVHPTAL